MNVSGNALSIIKEFEGLELEAYRDPVGIPTIGYGTIRYPNGRKVRMGDSISEQEAEAFLKFETDQLAEDLSDDVSGINLNQNQFDALVSFCYNVGRGAFRQSTMLARLKEEDFAAAAVEFPRWNKATVGGVKKELNGLTRRRARERSLFEASSHGEAPFGPDLSEEEQVTKAMGFRSDTGNVIVAYGTSMDVIEILELENSSPETLLSALRLYPKLEAFDFATQGESVPAGKRVKFSGPARPIIKVADAPVLNRDLLVIGVRDDEDLEGNDVMELQMRLKELGYYFGRLDGVFGKVTDDAVRDFQAGYFGVSAADGKVGPRTWEKLFGDTKAKQPGTGTPVGTNYLRLTKTDHKYEFGCIELELAYFKGGLFFESINVCSGAGRKQTFRVGNGSRAGSLEPLPEGKWFIRNIEWADGKDNYSGRIWNGGLGPVKIRLNYKEPGTTGRSDIEIHIDWNRRRNPGTAGCIGVENVADYKKLVGWLRETDPRELFVDWGLGTCPQPT